MILVLFYSRKMATTADEILKMIDSEIISLPTELLRVHTPIMQKMMNELLRHMRSVDDAFADLEPELLFLGSYFEGLKIVSPDEYDISIVLKLPKSSLFFECTEACEGFTRLIVEPKSPVNIELGNTYMEVHNWTDTCLVPARLRQWLQSVIQRALNKLPYDCIGKTYELLGHRIAKKPHGTVAYTVTLSGGTIDGEIDIDLVPVFAFNLNQLPRTSHLQEIRRRVSFNEDFWLAVPKGPKSCREPILNEICWKMHCQPQEKQLLKDKYNLKPTIRLLKKFRHEQEMDISSYSIKTLFFWEIKAQNFNTTFWQKNSLSVLFQHMLIKLLKRLVDRNMPDFWFPNHNMWQGISEVEFKKWIVIIKDMVNITNNVGRGFGFTKRFLNNEEMSYIYE